MNKAKLQRGDDVINWKSIRSAMKLYNNLDQLGQHLLTRLMVVENRRKKAAYSETVYDFGLALKELLSEALESLKPSEQEPKIPGHEWRPYKVLKETYIHHVGKKHLYLANEVFHISKRAYERWLKDSLQRLSNTLNVWEQTACTAQSARHQLAAIPDKPQNHEIVGRDELTSSIKAQLLKGGKNVSIPLQCGPGVGKTAIAVELAHHPEIEDYFQGGVFWAGLEEKTKWMKGRKTAEILIHLSRWGDVLGISAERVAKATDVEGRKRLLEQEIGSDRWLIVIDNVWELELAQGLQLNAPNCAYLIIDIAEFVPADQVGRQWVSKIYYLGPDKWAGRVPTGSWARRCASRASRPSGGIRRAASSTSCSSGRRMTDW